jgi:PAS domain S-box-containing protein
MREMFLAQIDYVFFVYGFAFILLASVCASLSRVDKSDVPWHWLAFFGLTHGVNEWLDMVAISFGDATPFKWVRLMIMIFSFIFLLEFGRSTLQRFKVVSIGRWIYIPLLCTVVLSQSWGISGVNAVSRYCLGLVGGVWAAAALWQLSRLQKNGGQALLFSSMAMFLYAISSGFIVPQVDLLTASIINQDSFIQYTGFPVQLLRGFLASMIAFFVWDFQENFRLAGEELVVKRKEVLLRTGLFVALFILISGGWFLVDSRGRAEAVQQREKLLSIVQQGALMLDPEQVKYLTASSADLESPVYERLKSWFQVFQTTVHEVRFAYLMRWVEDRVVFLVDSEPAGSADESPPGQVYDEAAPQIKEVFVSGKSSVEGPSVDRWGSWVSAFAPLKDGRTGDVIAVFGIDQSARSYIGAVLKQRFQGIFLIGCMGIFICLIFVFRQRFAVSLRQVMHGKKVDFWVSWGMVIIVFFFGGILTIGSYIVSRNYASDIFEKTFMQRAVSRSASVSDALRYQIESLGFLQQYFQQESFVDRAEFSRYVKVMLQGVPLQALAWAPRVDSKSRRDFESLARQEGLQGFRIFEHDAQGQDRPAFERDFYFPAYYLEPVQGNEHALGFDLASETFRRAAMEKSCDQGFPVATSAIELVVDSRLKKGVLVFLPVYTQGVDPQTVEERRKNLRGFVVGVYNVEEFLKQSWSKLPAEGLACLIEDFDRSGPDRILYRHAVRLGFVDWSRPVFKYEMPLYFAGRLWRMTVVPSSTFLKNYFSYSYVWILPIGLLFTALMAIFLNLLVTGRYSAEKLVYLRTVELSKKTEALEESEKKISTITLSAQDAILMVNAHGKVSFWNPAAEKIFGYTWEDISSQSLGDIFLTVEFRRIIDDIILNASGQQGDSRISIELYARRKDGVEIPVEASFATAFLGNEWQVVAIMRDITERKQTQDAIKSVNDRLEIGRASCRERVSSPV